MNVVLPEKEKIKKKTIFIYSIAAIACILAIAVVVGIQILGNDTIDSIFKINKIINKTEQEEAQLKANFSNLYDNKFYNNNNVNVTKIDENKDIVYTNYEKIETNNNYEINVVLPYINIKNSKIQRWNEEIVNTLYPKSISSCAFLFSFFISSSILFCTCLLSNPYIFKTSCKVNSLFVSKLKLYV